ncbi:MAG: hypothetical protein HC798_03970 [Polaribacter sp.]|nr:hypothetical protein [Polaribacter sp.]
MTKPIKKALKKRNKRDNIKYPALDKGVNLVSRKDYIESDYINGVFDSDGKEVIRPMTDSEKQWLNKFYEETIITNFQHNNEIKTLNKQKKNIIIDKVVQGLLSNIKN